MKKQIKTDATYKEVLDEVYGGAEKEYVTDEHKLDRLYQKEKKRALSIRQGKPVKGKTIKRR